jgi:hypothetical protein
VAAFAAAAPAGAAPNLFVTHVDATGLACDCLTLEASGLVRVTVLNAGTTPATGPFDVGVFDDSLANGQWDGPVADGLMGAAILPGTLDAGSRAVVDVVVAAAPLPFRDAAVHAVADMNDVVPESDEADNVAISTQDVAPPPPPGPFTLGVTWDWGGPRCDIVEAMVADMNADGHADVIVNHDTGAGTGVVRVMDGRDGSLIWTSPPAQAILAWNHVAVGNLDDDPELEVVAEDRANPWRLVAIDDTGLRLWTSPPLHAGPIDFSGGPSIADLDCDGVPEVILGAYVVSGRDGSVFWTPEPGGTTGADYGAISVAVDLDPAQNDGLEVVCGSTAYKWNGVRGAGSVGAIAWNASIPPLSVPEGNPAVGNFDADPEPEIVIASMGLVTMLEGDTGAFVWQQALPMGGGGCSPATVVGSGAPTIADLDGDGDEEIAVATTDWLCAYEGDGAQKWCAPTSDCSSARTASAAFDFDGDGAMDLAYRDEVALRILRGRDGAELASMPATSGTLQEGVAIADVDGDGHANVVVTMADTAGLGLSGVRVVEETGGRWPPARAVWNEHAYHIDNVLDDGSIPPGTAGSGCEAPSWLRHGTFRAQVNEPAPLQPDLTLAIRQVEVLPRPGCTAALRLQLRAGNGGATRSGRPVDAWIYDGDPGLGGVALGSTAVPDLDAGEWRDVVVLVPSPGPGTIDLHVLLDDDGSGAPPGLVLEVREDNNACSTSIVDGIIPPAGPPGPMGPALRARNHGDPNAPDITAEFLWTLDASLPRGPGEHYHLLRSIDPRILDPIPGTEPWTSLTWADSTPRAVQVPLVHFYLVHAANCAEDLAVEAP